MKDRDVITNRLSRRAAIATVAVAPLAGQFSACLAADTDVAQLIERAAAKNAAFMRGDMDRWLSLVLIAPDFTLMQPFGGPASRGFNASPERLAEMAKVFQNGDTSLDIVHAFTSDEFVVLVMIERQQAEVGGLPKQNWSLRVTEVYRKASSDWQLVHRHADPLVSRITIHEAATLARGGRKED